MTLFRSLLQPALAALLAASLATPAWAQAGSGGVRQAEENTERTAERSIQRQEQGAMIAQSGDCYAIGERVAAQNGGTLARATASSQGGRAVCVIVVLVPAKDGQRPRRTEIVVPQN